jgi:hypothetical protein
VECQNPYPISIDEWREIIGERTDLHWVLINTPPMFEQFDKIPSFDQYEKAVLQSTLSYAQLLQVPKVHLLMMDCSNEQER